MCGICGFVAPGIKEARQLEQMNSTLEHRGPDDQGVQLFSFNDLTIGLGHQRLSIIDLSQAGHQPMSDKSRELWITYNGEIYNYQELRQVLVSLGHEFNSQTDTEVILYAYKEWGNDCLRRLNGMFSFAIYDQRSETLFIARDGMGIKPLYYFSKNGHFAFASELKSLIAYKEFKKEIDLFSIYEYLSFQYIPSPRSIFSDTYKLEPGHYLLIDLDKNQIHKERYWEPKIITGVLDEFTKENSELSYLEKLDTVLRQVITAQLVSDVPIGAFLSGGIDSSLVVSILAQVRETPLKTFTIGFHEANRDEAPHAKKIAAYLGTDHHEKYLTPQDVFDVIPKLVDFYDEPFADSSALPTYLVSKFARQYVSVALSGDGGDELFGGYTRYLRVARAVQIDRLLTSKVRKIFSQPLTMLSIDSLQRIGAGMQYAEPIELFHYLVAMWKGEDHSKLLGLNYDFSSTHFYNIWQETQNLPLLQRLMLVDQKTYLPDDGLTKVDRASMAHSLEVRVPLLDQKVIDFALTLPSKYKINGKTQKYLLKQLLGKYLPPDLYLRPKMGFVVPLNEWLRGDLKYLVDFYLSPERISNRAILNVDYLEEIKNKHMSGRYNYFYMLWTVIMLEMWFEKWMD